ncbi:MAG: PDZ domain-containing protein [Elusimicrobia bacterium]|nr:PDZ domain-containing protein [Elusimicrobiota bacterium]
MNTPSALPRIVFAASLLLALAPAWAAGGAPTDSGTAPSIQAGPADDAPARPARKVSIRQRPAPAARKPLPAQTKRPPAKAVPQEAASAPALPLHPAAVPMPDAPPAPAPSGTRDGGPVASVGSLTALGTFLRDGEDSAEALAVLPGSEAGTLGLQARDRLAFLNGAPVRSRGDAAQAWLGWDPALRLRAVARRGLQVVDLQSRFPGEEPAFVRGPQDISAREAVLKDSLLAGAAQSAQAVLARAPSLQVNVPAKQVLWMRFPDGLPYTVGTGDILAGEVTMAVASDASLDFLCLPPRSTVWGKVLHTSESDGVRSVRIHFFKASLAGGHIIPISARLTDAAGKQPLLKVSPGGSLVMGEPVSLDQKKKRRSARILEPDVRLRLELTEPIAVTEPPQFYPAGAGLWIKTKDTEAGRVFEVTLVIPGRSAEKAGLRVGDMLTAIAGRATARMDFGEALAALYGAPGTGFKVAALKPGADKPATLELKRGVFYKDGVETPVPLPFEKRA